MYPNVTISAASVTGTALVPQLLLLLLVSLYCCGCLASAPLVSHWYRLVLLMLLVLLVFHYNQYCATDTLWYAAYTPQVSRRYHTCTPLVPRLYSTGTPLVPIGTTSATGAVSAAGVSQMPNW